MCALRPCARRPNSLDCGRIARAGSYGAPLADFTISKDAPGPAFSAIRPLSTVARGATLREVNKLFIHVLQPFNEG